MGAREEEAIVQPEGDQTKLLEGASQETEVQLEIVPEEEKDKDVQSATAVKAMSSKQMSTMKSELPKKLPKSVIRIIMFSSCVDSTLPNYENANITNIVWEQSENMEKFSGNEEASTAVQTFESLTGHSLSVINIITPFSAKDNCINLYGNKENQLIAFLDTNCDRNLVIFLPLLRHHQFCNLENLKKILSLRRKAVVVTIAKMMPKFPTTEIITGIGEVMDEEQFKVADITVPVKKNGKTKSKVEKEGVAKVVGLAAALLHAGCSQTSGVVDLSSFVWRVMVAYLERHPNLFKSSQLEFMKAEEVSKIMKSVTEDREQTFPGLEIVRSGTRGSMLVDTDQRIKIAFILEKKQGKMRKDAKLVGNYFRCKSEEPVEFKGASLPDEVYWFKEDLIGYIKDAYNFIHLTVHEIDTKDVNCLTQLSEILNRVRECSVVFQTCVDMDVPDDHPVMKSAFYLQKHSVFVSAAKARTSDLSPQFPCTLSIAAGTNEPKAKEQQLLGSTLDFVCRGKSIERAAVSVVVLIVLFLREAISQKELSKNRFNSICTTPVMQRILHEMCSHPEHHNSTEGWGVLDVQNAIQTKIRDHHQLGRLISVDPKTIFWNGKNM